MKIGIVGPCAAGKTTLATGLQTLGWDARDIAQEHSGVPTMWRQVTNPDVLLYLDAALPTICARLRVNWEQAYLDELNRRLTDARAHAHFYLNTDALTISQVRDQVVAFLHTLTSQPR
jgi:deoxyadenosine/deoxycytidine kinase